MAGPNSNFLDPLLSPTITDDGEAKPRRKNLNLIGFTVADNPDTESTDVTNTGGGGPGSVIALADHAAFRALSSAPADGTVIHFQDPIGTFVYSSSEGAGQADDDRTILKLTSVSSGSNGRAYSVDGAILPSLAALRLAVSGTQTSVNVQAFATGGDGGGGIFDKISGTTTDNGGTLIQPSGASFYYQRRFSGPVNVVWFGAKGDGSTNDQPAITSATSAVGTGGALYFPPLKTYFLNSAWTYASKTRTKIFSDGPGATIKLKKNTHGLDISSCTGLEIAGLRFQGTAQTDGGDEGGGNDNQHAMTLVSVTDGHVHHCTLQDTGGYGCWIGTGNTNVTVDHNDFLDTMAGCQSGASSTANNRRITIRKNYFRGFMPTGGSGTLGSDDQIAFFGNGSQITIEDNIIDKQGTDATTKAKVQAQCIDVTYGDTSGAGLTDVVIRGNTCLNCISTHATKDRPAIQLATISGNDFENVVIDGNTIRDCVMGIRVLGGIKRLGICGNKIYNVVTGSTTSPDGIQVFCSDAGDKAIDVTIDDNVIQGAERCGILVYQVDGVHLGNNRTRDTGLRGIQATFCSDVAYYKNRVNDSGTNEGIYGQTNTNVDVEGNRVDGAGTYGIGLDTCTDVSISGNKVTTSGSYALNLNSIGRFSVHDEHYVSNAALIGISGSGCTGSFRTIHKHGNTASTIDDSSSSPSINYDDLRDAGTNAERDITGTLKLTGLGTGVVHADSTGLLSSSTIVNADVNAAAAIAYTKLNLSGTIVNADISSSALIAVGKLSNGTAGQFLIENSGATAPAWTSVSGDIAASTSTPGQFKITTISGNGAATIEVGAGLSGAAWLEAATSKNFVLKAKAGQFMQVIADTFYRDVDTHLWRNTAGSLTQMNLASSKLRVGDGTAASEALEVAGNITTTAAGRFKWNSSHEQTTVGAAGGASAIPASPTKYLKITDSTGATLVIPAFAAS